MSAAGAQPFWRAAGMTYLGYANRCAVFVRKCQKEPFKTQSLDRETVHFKVAPWADGVQQKAEIRGTCSIFLNASSLYNAGVHVTTSVTDGVTEIRSSEGAPK